jgi:hypothetical protein
MSQLGDVFAHHPWWMAAAMVLAATVALWIIVGGELLEKRHGEHIFGPEEHSG